MLTHIVKFLKKLKVIPNHNVPEKLILGRWCILNPEYNNRKIDMANIDHCGTCFYNYKKETSAKADIVEENPPPNPK